MALVTPKMSLRVWDTLNDPYNHDQLADNWSKVDLHDHTPGRGVQIPTEGIADSAITQAKLGTIVIATSQIAGNAITTSQILDGTILDTDLASPNNLAYRTLTKSLFTVTGGITAGTYFSQTQTGLVASGSSGAPGATIWAPDALAITAADYAVAGKAATCRVRIPWITNATAPTSTFTFGLYPITASAGASTAIGVTLGTVVAGSTAVLAAPALSSQNQIVSTDFGLPGTGIYVFGCVVSVATTAAASVTAFTPHLQIHWV